MIDITTLSEGKKYLHDVGLNIFLCAKVCDFPSDIFPFTENQKKKTLVMLGHGGKTLWENLPHPLNPKEHPIDHFTLKHLHHFANFYLNDDVHVLYPGDDSLLPLQQFGRFFQLSHQTPMGIDISKNYGTWFAYRAVFLTQKELPFIGENSFCSPCDECALRPCIEQGRNSCPIKKEHLYTHSQQEYHALQLPFILD